MFKPCTFAWQVKSSEHLEGRNRNIHPSPKLGTPHFFLINKFGTMVTNFKNLCFYGCPMFKEMSQVNMAFNEENFGGDFDQLLRQQSLSSACILIIGLYDMQFGLKYSSLTFYTTHSLTRSSPLASSSCSTSSSSSSTSTSWSVRASTSWCWSSCGRKTPPLRWVDEDITGLYGMLGEEKSQFFIQNRKRIHSKYRFILLPWVHYYLAKPIPHIW